MATSNTAPPVPQVRSCGTMPVHERLLRTDPEYRRLRIVSENHHFEFRLYRGLASRTGITQIPVVVHVVWKQAAHNISDAQIQSQIDVLNRDYRRKNGDLGKIPAPFKALAADARIEFKLADKDPAGQPSTGITRTKTTADSFGDDDKVKHAATGGHDAWPRDRYLNIWVCQLGGGLLGYAQFPGGPADTDGVVILHSGFGTTGTAAAPFNLGRTTTHEVAHWLNLRHIWGDDGGGCNGDDYVADTPNQGDHNFGKPSFPRLSCNNGPNGDMFMNYMDYTDDDSMFMFTTGQVERMQACLDGDRAGLGTQLGTTLPAADAATLKFRDDTATLAAADTVKIPPTDAGSLKFRDDTGTLPALDTATLKFRDDVATLKFRDDPMTVKNRDDVKLPVLDKLPVTDQVGTGLAGDLVNPGPGPVINPGPQGRAGGGWGGAGGVPFVLSTPHHSMAWTHSFPQAAQAEMQALAQQIAEHEQLLNQYAQADAAGQLGDADRVQADALTQAYEALLAEYQRYGGV